MSNKEDRPKRMRELIIRNQQNKPKEYSELFIECVDALGLEAKVLSDEDSEKMYDELQSKFKFTSWGRIDWDRVEEKEFISDVSEISLSIQANSKTMFPVFILWGYGDDPVIQAKIDNVVQAIDDIVSVGGDQWVYCPEGKYVVEIYHDGEITIGFLK